MTTPDTFFTWASLGTVTGAALVVVIVSNALRKAWRIRKPWLPFVVSLIVAFAGAAAAKTLGAWADYLVTFFNACLLFCTATGMHETVVAGAKGDDGDKAQLHLRKPVSFLSSWVRPSAD